MNPIDLSHGGKLETTSKIKVTQENLAKIYTPGVAEICKEISKNPKEVYNLTWKKRAVAVVSDGTAILGLGDIGPEAGLPVMEAKSLLFKQLGGVDAVPIVLDTKDPAEIIQTIKNIAPTFGAINLEDIAAPNCFKVQAELEKELSIPVFHDDQDGTAIVTLAGLINATKLTEKDLREAKIVISGAGAAGLAIANLLLAYGAKYITIFDSRGAIFEGREDLNFYKKEISKKTNLEKFSGDLNGGITEADIFIGVSSANLLTADDIKKMNERAIVFALANPDPEILPDEAVLGGAFVTATGRSDFDNQINNALVFPGIFKGLLQCGAKKVIKKNKLDASLALAGVVKNPTKNNILPEVMDKKAVEAVAGVF